MPEKQKNIYLGFNNELFKNYKINDVNVEIKDINNLRFFRWEKSLEKEIKPTTFIEYFKDYKNRNNIYHNEINATIKEIINENEWIEEYTYMSKIIIVKFIVSNYEIIAYEINNDRNPKFELFNLKIIQNDNLNILRLFMAFNEYDFENELVFMKYISIFV